VSEVPPLQPTIESEAKVDTEDSQPIPEKSKEVTDAAPPTEASQETTRPAEESKEEV
jgi:hypothetical protein